MQNYRDIDISHELIDAIESFPMSQQFSHCGQTFEAPPFDIYVVCPVCQITIKVRSFSSYVDIEDVFDAVFCWMMKPGAEAIVKARQDAIKEIEGE